jgi:hypothetical protein
MSCIGYIPFMGREGKGYFYNKVYDSFFKDKGPKHVKGIYLTLFEVPPHPCSKC